MQQLIWIEMKEPDDATRLAEALESSGLDAATGKTIRGKPEVLITKPRLRRMRTFLADVESVVRRWLEHDAAHVEGVLARTLDRGFEIRSPIADRIARRSRHGGHVRRALG